MTTTPILVTGAAGFIGYHVAQRLLELGYRVVGLDNLNDYYPVQLKLDRLAQLTRQADFQFLELDVADQASLGKAVAQIQPSRIVHLAAQGGVRYSIQNPAAYVQSNLVGFANILECSRQHEIAHLVYASSSSVYGANTKMPFAVEDSVGHPVSLYAATKRANELMAHSYSHLFQLPTTGLRFFTVYGPWGRPDMAPMLFASAIAEGRSIDVFNDGKMRRDFTYVDDIAEGVVQTLMNPATPDPTWDAANPNPSSSNAPWRIHNIGNHEPVQLLHFIELLEAAMGKTATKIMKPLQPGDVIDTFADSESLRLEVGYVPSTSIEKGVVQFVRWFKDYYQV